MVELEGLTLLKANNKAGYFGVHRNTAGYQARVRRGGNVACLGRFATAEEAALCVARSPEGQAAAKRAAAASVPLTSKEARQQAQAEGLTLRVAGNKAGYRGVGYQQTGHSKPYQAQVQRGGKTVFLGLFATAEEAALCAARSRERQAAAKRAAESPPLILTGDGDGGGDAGEVEGEEQEFDVLDAVEVLGAWTDDDGA